MGQQRDAQPPEHGDTSHASSLPSRPPSLPPANRRSAIAGVIAVLLVIALGVALFASMSAYRSARLASVGTPTAVLPSPTAPTVALSPTLGASPLRAPRRGAGLPKGMEVIAYQPTGPDEGWGTGGIITNTLTGQPDRSMVLHYRGGAWTTVGPALPGIYLGGIDMISSSEGWAMGGDGSGTSRLLHISNGAWQQIPLPPDPGAVAAVMAMRTPDEGWLAMANRKTAYSGANTSLFHTTGGAWSLVRTPLKYITDIAPVADGEAWVIGWNTDNTSSLVHVRGGVATVELISPGSSTFTRLRQFAPDDIWIEGAMHAPSNAAIEDVTLNYHFDGAAWSNVRLHVAKGTQQLSIVSSDTAWSFISVQQVLPDRTTEEHISSIYSNAGGQWQALSLPYKNLQSIRVVSSSSTDVWAVGIYMVTTPIPNTNNTEFSTVSHYVLLHYLDGSWTEYGR